MVMPPVRRPKVAVTVRMYTGLLGDCFLLRLRSAQGDSNILIDCGILQNIEGDRARMQAVARSIRRVTKSLDLLVVTHEHHDHISGFAHARDLFFGDDFTIQNLWMGWTENPEDAQAQALQARFDRTKLAMGLALREAADLAAAGAPDADGVLGGLEAFMGPLDIPHELGAAPRMTGRLVMQSLKEKALARRYMEPGEMTTTPGAAPLTAYVLGPPRNERRLFHDLPTHGAGKETFVDRFNAADQLLSAAPGAWLDGSERKPERPFAPRHGIETKQVNPKSADPPADPNAPVDGDVAWLRRAYYDGPDWRRVDSAWLGMAGALALKLDSDTNNTSLVLALEAPGGGVLLFAADAQVGNWLSWHDQQYGPLKVSAKDLLARTVFYKVGHHASHNATLDEQGLDLMTSGDLVAMIPVVEEDARRQGAKGWNMPYPPLLAALLEATSQRVIRGDKPTRKSLFKPRRLRTVTEEEGEAVSYVEYDVLV